MTLVCLAHLFLELHELLMLIFFKCQQNSKASRITQSVHCILEINRFIPNYEFFVLRLRIVRAISVILNIIASSYYLIFVVLIQYPMRINDHICKAFTIFCQFSCIRQAIPNPFPLYRHNLAVIYFSVLFSHRPSVKDRYLSCHLEAFVLRPVSTLPYKQQSVHSERRPIGTFDFFVFQSLILLCLYLFGFRCPKKIMAIKTVLFIMILNYAVTIYLMKYLLLA